MAFTFARIRVILGRVRVSARLSEAHAAVSYFYRLLNPISQTVLPTPAHLQFSIGSTAGVRRWMGEAGRDGLVVFQLSDFEIYLGPEGLAAPTLFYEFPDKNTRSVTIDAFQRARTNSDSIRSTVNSRVLPPIQSHLSKTECLRAWNVWVFYRGKFKFYHSRVMTNAILPRLLCCTVAHIKLFFERTSSHSF